MSVGFSRRSDRRPSRSSRRLRSAFSCTDSKMRTELCRVPVGSVSFSYSARSSSPWREFSLNWPFGFAPDSVQVIAAQTSGARNAAMIFTGMRVASARSAAPTFRRANGCTNNPPSARLIADRVRRYAFLCKAGEGTFPVTAASGVSPWHIRCTPGAGGAGPVAVSIWAAMTAEQTNARSDQGQKATAAAPEAIAATRN